jgi:agmatinase
VGQAPHTIWQGVWQSSGHRNMSHAIPDNFLGLSGKAANYTTASYAVLPVPYDATTSYGVGTRNGPRAIITASQQVELYDEDLGRESWQAGIATLDPLEPDSRGPEPTLERIQKAARKVVRDGKFLLTLGGEHSISIACIAAVHAKHKQLSVLQIDAHADLRDSYQGSPHSHAAVMRRVVDLGVPHVGVGIRNICKEEAAFIKKAGIQLITARQCHEEAAADWIARAIEPLTEQVYVTIDIDGFDPAYAPGTGTPEPGGLNWYQVADLLAAAAKEREIVAADIVEVRPIPPNEVTEFLAAKLAYRLVGLTSH